MNKIILLTGCTGAMGKMATEYLLKKIDNQTTIRLFVFNDKKDIKYVKRYKKQPNVELFIGDLSSYDDSLKAITNVDMVFHLAALVSPLADYHPDLAMKVNYEGTKNLVDAIINNNQKSKTKFINIGSIAQTGDRLPPLHWGKIGDPIKPSVFDYYAISKVKAERYVIESDLKYWVSLRQTGILGKEMLNKSSDPILFHNCLNNVLEYISDRDSGRLIANLYYKDQNNQLDPSFWNHIYNVGGGKNTRVDSISLYQNVYKILGIKDLSYVINPSYFATKNFHGTYYLDSDKLNDYLDFRHDTMDYFYKIVKKEYGLLGLFLRFLSFFPGGQKMIACCIKAKFRRIANKRFGPLNFIKNNLTPQIEAYFGSKQLWEKIPHSLKDFPKNQNLDNIIHLDYGYDLSKDEKDLNYDDLKMAASFRGGILVSQKMKTGDWKTKLTFKCAFGHTFQASPKLILEGGRWCDKCKNDTKTYQQRAKKDKFFAQVWR